MDLNNFPPQLLVCIFSYLNLRDIICSVRQTCKTWYQLSFERTFWKTIDLKRIRDLSFTSKTFKKMVKPVLECIESLHIDLKDLDIDILLSKKYYFPSLKHLYVTCSSERFLKVPVDQVDPQYYKDVLQLKQCLPGIAEAYDLLTIHLVDNYGVESVMQGMDNLFPSLTNIKVTGCKSEVECEKFFRGHRCLQHVSLHNSVISYETLSLIFEEFQDLRSLDLTNTDETSDLSFEQSKELLEFEDRAGFRSNLCKLVLDGISCDDYTFVSMIKGANNLKSISISNCTKITDIGAECLGKYCPRLEVVILKVNRFYECNITNTSLQVIAVGCIGLKVLKVNHCTEISDAGIEVVAAFCPDLEELEVEGCTALTDASLISIARNCPQIKRINISRCVKLTWKCVNILLHLSKQLVYLESSDCRRLSNFNTVDKTSEEVSKINAGATGTSEAAGVKTNDESVPQVVDIPEDKSNRLESTEYSEAQLKRLEQHCHMKILNLGFCSKLSNMCLHQISSQCPDLREVNLQGCSTVTNAGLKALVTQCKLLKILNVSGASSYPYSHLTDDFLDTVSEHGRCLEELIMVNNYNINVDAVFRVIQDCPDIRLITVSCNKYCFHLESLSQYAKKIRGKRLCINMSCNVKITVAKDLEYEH